jgi:hypothetical protein
MVIAVTNKDCHDVKCDYRRGLDWWVDLLTTYAHDSALYRITAQQPISTIQKSTQNPPNIFQRAVFTSRSLATVSNSGVYSISWAQVLSSQLPVQNSTELI